MVKIPMFRKEVGALLWQLKVTRENCEMDFIYKTHKCDEISHQLTGYLYACYGFDIIDTETFNHICKLQSYAYLGRRLYKKFKQEKKEGVCL